VLPVQSLHLHEHHHDVHAWLGIPIARGFPDFEQFYSASFPAGTPIVLKSCASASFATPA